MESILKGIPGVVVYIDDVLVTGKTEEEHLAALEETLSRLERAGLRLQKKKCSFMAPSVTYLGHQIDQHGLHPVADKVKAIKEAPRPRNKSELKSFLGLLSYYSRFLPNMSTTLAPLYRLLRHDASWSWAARETASFEAAKSQLLSSQVLAHYDPNLELVVACDASAYGVGAVLSHRLPDGTEKPIGFASRTLSDTEKKYSQIEKEGLACVFGVARFHTYVYGRHFTLITDHKPLQSLFDGKHPVSPQASGRIQRWALKLAMYEYDLECRSTYRHGNADALSRLPLSEKPPVVPRLAEHVLLMEHLSNSPVTAMQIKSWTRRDPILAQVLRCIKGGWPSQATPRLQVYWLKRFELSLLDDCILWGNRVLVPEAGRQDVLSELHGGHPGSSRMKTLARMFVWWPNIDQDIEKLVNTCSQCQQVRPSPPASPLQPWHWPTRPWARVHVDFAGPINGKMLLIVIDAHSKWIEAQLMTSTTTTATVEQLRIIFSQHGIPETMVSDNGPQFASEEFEQFCRKNGIRHVRVAPYHPSSNGLAERAVQTVKQGLRKMTEGSLQLKLSRFLFSYRITPQSTTGRSPAELLMQRQLRSCLNLVQPSLSERVLQQQNKQKEDHDKHAQSRFFSEGEEVFVKNYGRHGNRWLEGIIIALSGPVSAVVELSDGNRVKRHFEQLRKRHGKANKPVRDPESALPEDLIPVPEVGLDSSRSEPESDTNDESSSPDSQLDPGIPSSEPSVSSPSEAPSVKRYPSRIRQPPNRFE